MGFGGTPERLETTNNDFDRPVKRTGTDLSRAALAFDDDGRSADATPANARRIVRLLPSVCPESLVRSKERGRGAVGDLLDSREPGLPVLGTTNVEA